jgi:catechol 2,3-dioxygenase-like lactoylglutathione lyase family enzyme
MTAPTMDKAVPVLLSLDIAATVRFFTTTLGFTCRYQSPGKMAILKRDSVEIIFTACQEQHLVDWSCCRIGVTGIDALYEGFSSHSVVHPNGKLRDTDYGTREFGVLDPHGVLITFYETTPAVT